jgi:hypothetical protein
MRSQYLIPGLILALALLTPGRFAAQQADPRIAALVDSVSADRLGATVNRLEGFGTRHLLSDTVSTTRGIGAARRWIFEEFRRASPRLQVSYDDYLIPPGGRVTRDVLLRNVVAVLPGRSPRRIYVSGHYDTIARPAGGAAFDFGNGDLPSPGANDDGSGTALVLELARVVAQSAIAFDATIVFVAFAGEEQGLVGASHHAQTAADQTWTIDAVLNNDIVGGVLGGNGLSDSRTVRVFSEGPEDSPSRQLARYVRVAAARYVPSQTVRLIARYDRFGRGGDHTPFNQHGYAAVRITEATENYSRQHTVDDTFEGVSPPYLARNAKVDAAALASLALAPPAPVVTSTSGAPMLGRGTTGYDATLRWQAAPGAAGYHIYWREAWSQDWQYDRTVSDVTEVALPNVSVDDFVFGVAALSPTGQESLVAAYVNPARPPVEPRPRPGS